MGHGHDDAKDAPSENRELQAAARGRERQAEAVEPRIWRRVLVPSEVTLHRLHAVLQAVMGWENSHLYRLEVDRTEYGESAGSWASGARGAPSFPMSRRPAITRLFGHERTPVPHPTRNHAGSRVHRYHRRRCEPRAGVRHEKRPGAVRHGATHIHAHGNKDERARLAEEADLIASYNPPCNERG